MTLHSDATSRIENLLESTIGLDGSTVGTSLIHRAAMRRMSARAIDDLDRYAELVAHDARELQELVEEVVVTETYFFREREALFALAALVQRQLLVPRENEPLRVLSAPCSTGEEPFSIAITLLAAGLPPEQIAIDGVDVSKRAVQAARRASYRRNSFRSQMDRWNDYFIKKDDAWEPVDRVRGLVRIEEANILAPAFLPPHDRYDAIFCRNLLIYFDLDAQERLIGALVRHLAPSGVLFVGAADTFAVRRAGFVALGNDLGFAYRLAPEQDRATAQARADITTITPHPRRPSVSVPVERSSSKRHSTAISRRTLRKTTVQPDRISASTATPAMSDIGAMEEIASLANAGRLEDAARLGDTAVAGDDYSASLLALLGTIAAALGDGAGAERHYRRALYLEPGHEETLLHLATLLDGRGDRAGADRLRARARRGQAATGAR